MSVGSRQFSTHVSTLLAVFLGLCVCQAILVNGTSTRRSKSRIYRGQTNTAGYPWLGVLSKIESTKNGDVAKGFCGATIIAKEWALTSAECVYGEVDSDLLLAYGQTNAKTEMFEIVPVSLVILHDSFAPIGPLHEGLDMALLRLQWPINATTIALNKDPRLDEPGTELTTAGWGMIEVQSSNNAASRNQSAGDLQEVKMTIIERKECLLRLKRLTFPGYICATAADKASTCPGDEGGPLQLVTRTKQCQVGIVSYMNKDDCSDTENAMPATMFVMISQAFDWIRGYVDDVKACR